MIDSIFTRHLLELCDGQRPEIELPMQEKLLHELQLQGIMRDNPNFEQRCFQLYAEFCIAQGADVDCQDVNDGQTPLIKAANRRDTDLVALLLKSNAKIDKYDFKGHTALHAACSEGAYSIVKQLLAKGASVLAQTDMRWFPIHFAIQHPRIVLALLLKKSPVNAKTLTLDTPLHFAATHDAPMGTFQALLAFDADFTQKNLFGETPLDILKTKPLSTQFQLLLSEDNAFKEKCTDHADVAKNTFLVMMNLHHNRDNPSIPAMPPEMSLQITDNIRPSDFEEVIHDGFFNPEDEPSLIERLSRLALM